MLLPVAKSEHFCDSDPGRCFSRNVERFFQCRQVVVVFSWTLRHLSSGNLWHVWMNSLVFLRSTRPLIQPGAIKTHMHYRQLQVLCLWACLAYQWFNLLLLHLIFSVSSTSRFQGKLGEQVYSDERFESRPNAMDARNEKCLKWIVGGCFLGAWNWSA